MKSGITKVIFLCLVAILAFFAGFLVNQVNIKVLTEQIRVKQNELDTIKSELTVSKVTLDRVMQELDKIKNTMNNLTIPPAIVNE